MVRPIGALVLWLAAGAHADEGPPPRYRLEAGQELVFVTKTVWTSKALLGLVTDTGGETTRRRVCVVGNTPAGGWRLVIVSTTRREDEEPVTMLQTCELFRDGRFEPHPTLGPDFDPAALFPPLPPVRGAPRWEGRNVYGEILRCEELSSRKPWRYRVRVESPPDSVAGFTREAEVTFDRARGLPVRIAMQRRYAREGNDTFRETTTLESVRRTEKARWRRLGREAARLFDVEQRIFSQPRPMTEAEVALAIAAAAKAWRGLRDRLTLPLLQTAVDGRLKLLDAWAADLRGDARRFARWVGKPAPAWKLRDLDGAEHTLETYRGDVVVLDFWYRECGWCLRAMAKLNRLAARFAGRPVRLLGMNVDRDPQDARVVAEALGLRYPTLLARKTRVDYGVLAYPTLVIVDRKGVVRRILTGYGPYLEEQIARCVEALLAEAGGAERK